MSDILNLVPTGFPALPIQLKTGQEPFQLKGQNLPHLLLDFWRWSGSDLLNNTQRGRLAEFIVAQAIGVSAKSRVEWDSYDLLSTTGIRIEIKSAAYLQSWYHKKLSPIKFNIPATIAWNVATNTYETESKRQSDVYIFCLLYHPEKQTINPLNIDQWKFYMLATSLLNQVCPNQKSITLKRLIRIGAKEVTYEALATLFSATSQQPGEYNTFTE